MVFANMICICDRKEERVVFTANLHTEFCQVRKFQICKAWPNLNRVSFWPSFFESQGALEETLPKSSQ